MCMKVSVCFELLFFHLGWAVLVICKEVLRVYVREDFLAWHDSERGREGGRNVLAEILARTMRRC